MLAFVRLAITFGAAPVECLQARHAEQNNERERELVLRSGRSTPRCVIVVVRWQKGISTSTMNDSTRSPVEQFFGRLRGVVGCEAAQAGQLQQQVGDVERVEQ